ncbi:ATP-binding protein [Marinobacterium rhizophilum]|uniref:histidine kinase n=1 Tax=Marinobacterium rhizophilum TaxID=420402 RepID=A0ABY5HKW6_9GAMM|nr:ATP-binding protein [Marinobacterium rhizophilum]UTW11882.1 PAS domain-containing protein [Marinobacterium rhizophilum]
MISAAPNLNAALRFNDTSELVYVSPQMLRLLGYDDSVFFVSPLTDLIPELTDERIAALWQQTMAEGSARLQCHLVDCSGGHSPVDIRFGRIQAGGQMQLCACVQPMVASSEAERLLQLVARTTAQSTGSEFFRVLARSLAEVLNVDGALITECLDFPTTRVHTLAYWTHRDFTGNIDYDLADTPCEKVVQEGRVCLYASRLTERYPKDAGAESYLGVPIFDADNQRVIGHMAFFDSQAMPDGFYHKAVFDIFCARASAELQRMQATRNLRLQEQKYRLLVENQQELVAQLDSDGRFKFASPSLCEFFARTEASLMGMPLLDLVQTSDQLHARACWSQLGVPGQHGEFEHRVDTERGERWLSWSLKAAMEQGALHSVIAVGRDITERREAEENARQVLQDLAHLSRVSSMGEMASAFAHEVNQPLCAILTYSQACLRLLGSETTDVAEIRHAMERVAANAELAGDIIQQMRNFLRKGEPDLVMADIFQVLQDSITLARVELRDDAIEIQLECEQPLPPVRINVTQIEQVILNYLCNARDAMKAAGRTGKVSIRAHHSAPRELQISVLDQGPGIDSQLLDRVFEPFVTSKTMGIGIGLSICKSIVEAHGGRVGGFNHPQGGACFQLTLPLVGEGGGA